jgi:glycosyltransferase involved in cell wall biosynthesis
MTAAPFLSICVMTYNRASTLRETLASILPQVDSLQEVEVVVCDNASTDGTSEMVRQLLPLHPRLRYHRNPQNLGFDGNVVTCIKEARGEYTAFFSDDDLAPPGHFQTVIARLREFDPLILYVNHTAFYFHDPQLLASPLSPQVFREFSDGQDFVMFAGLGFISSLVLKTAPARQFISKVKPETGTAHITLASWMALKTTGRFIYDGVTSVHSRFEPAGSPILVGGYVNPALLYRELTQQGLLDRSRYKQWLEGQVAELPRAVFTAMGRRGQVAPFSQMKELYGRTPGFYWKIAPFYFLPRHLVALAYMILHPIFAACRSIRLRRLK